MSNIKKINICGISDVGKKRSRNEDAFLIGNIVERTGIVSLSLEMNSLSIQEQGLLTAVADGMGGMGGGHIASTLGLYAFSRHYYSDTYSKLSANQVMEIIKASVMKSHKTISEGSEKNPLLMNMGTTLVGLNIFKGHFFRFHAGDSRLYHFQNGILKQITRDHSLVQLLLDAGKLKKEDVEKFSRKNEIINSVGAGIDCHPEIAMLNTEDVHPGDIFLLCSDGFSNMLDHSELPEELAKLKDSLKHLKEKESGVEKIKDQWCPGEDLLSDSDIISRPDNLQKKYSDICNGISRFYDSLKGGEKKLSSFLSGKEMNPIEEILKQPLCIEDKARFLIQSANDRDADDNLTVVLMELT